MEITLAKFIIKENTVWKMTHNEFMAKTLDLHVSQTYDPVSCVQILTSDRIKFS
jgi:hypothetical protein